MTHATDELPEDSSRVIRQIPTTTGWDEPPITLTHIKREDGTVTGGLVNGPGILIDWQEGTVGDLKIRGAFIEDLIAVVLHRLNTVNAGPLRNRHSSLAATHLEMAGLWLRARQADRKQREVANTYEP